MISCCRRRRKPPPRSPGRAFRRPANFLRRPELRRPFARNGRRPDPRATLLLHKTRRCAGDGRADAPYPGATNNLHHEIELVVAILRGGAAIPVAEAQNHIYGYAVGLDLTRRDLQSQAKEARRPWDMSKGFDFSAPLGLIEPATKIGHPKTGRIALKVNGDLRQDGDLPT